MKPKKYTFKQAAVISFGTKIIYKYPTSTKKMDLGVMVVNGRHPQGKNIFLYERECDFVIYVLRGSGKIFAGSEIFEVSKKDVVFVPRKNKFAVEGKLEYVTVNCPAFFPEQSKEIGKKRKV